MDLELSNMHNIEALGRKGSISLNKRDLSAFNEQQQGFTDAMMEEVITKLRVLSIDIGNVEDLSRGLKRMNIKVNPVPPQRKSFIPLERLNNRFSEEFSPPRILKDKPTRKQSMDSYSRVWIDSYYKKLQDDLPDNLIKASGTHRNLLYLPKADVLMKYEKFDLEKWVQKVLLSYYYSCNPHLNTVD
jgi:hypothetical protein